MNVEDESLRIELDGADLLKLAAGRRLEKGDVVVVAEEDMGEKLRMKIAHEMV